MQSANYHPRLHWFALLTTTVMFFLIFMGGLVTSHHAGMAVPDWPNTYGYNMFLFPISKWVGGIFYEHVHRLMATVVGMLSIITAVTAWRTESRRTVRLLAYALLGATIFQGVLGGLRVIWNQLNLAVVHGCIAQAVFCLGGLLTIATSQWWMEAPDLSRSNDHEQGRTFIRLGLVAVLVIYSQLVVGAVMRHYKAGLAIPDLPLNYGKWLPPRDASELAAANRLRLAIPPRGLSGDSVEGTVLAPVTLPQVWIHFAHRMGAILVTTALVVLIVHVLRFHRRRGLTSLAVALIGLLLTQLTLGVLTVLLQKPADIASSHVAVGALTLLTTFVLLTRSWRLYIPRETALFGRQLRDTQALRMGKMPMPQQ